MGFSVVSSLHSLFSIQLRYFLYGNVVITCELREENQKGRSEAWRIQSDQPRSDVEWEVKLATLTVEWTQFSFCGDVWIRSVFIERERARLTSS